MLYRKQELEQLVDQKGERNNKKSLWKERETIGIIIFDVSLACLFRDAKL